MRDWMTGEEEGHGARAGRSDVRLPWGGGEGAPRVTQMNFGTGYQRVQQEARARRVRAWPEGGARATCTEHRTVGGLWRESHHVLDALLHASARCEGA